MTMNKLALVSLFISLGFFLVPSLASAQDAASSGAVNSSGTGVTSSGVVKTNPATGQGQTVSLINPLKSGANLESFLQSILAFVIRLGTIAVILMLVFVGYKFVAAQGAPGKIEEARGMLMWTVIGALILLGAQAISMGIQATVTALSAGS